MTYEIEKPSPCLVRLQAVVPSAEAEALKGEITRQFVVSAELPGFRRGKAPMALVARRFAARIQAETEERLLRRVWDEAVAAEKLRVAGPLGVLESRWEASGNFVFKGEFEVFPEVTLPPLASFQPPAFSLEPSEDEVEEFLRGLAERQATWQVVEDGCAEDGMLVEAEVLGEFPEGRGTPFREERTVFRLGSGEVYPEIEEAVRGARLGAEVTARREVVKEGDESPMTVQYTLTVKGLRRRIVPALDGDFATKMGVEGGLEGLREKARELLRKAKERERVTTYRHALVKHLQGDQPLSLPDRLVDEETRREAYRYARSVQRQGFKAEELNWQELIPKLRESVMERLREELVLDQLAMNLGVRVQEQDVDAAVRREAQESGVPFVELKGNLAKAGGLERIRGILRRERAVAQVLEPLLKEG